MAPLVANMVCLPIADKLHGKLTEEDINRTLIIDGILMIRDSRSPAWCAKCCSPICPKSIAKRRWTEAAVSGGCVTRVRY